MSRLQRAVRPKAAAPRGSVLVGLGAGVLLAHLGLLSGGFSGLSLDLFAAPDIERTGSATPIAAAASTTLAASFLPELPEPVRSSRVRWIVPKVPEPEPKPKPPTPVRKQPASSPVAKSEVDPTDLAIGIVLPLEPATGSPEEDPHTVPVEPPVEPAVAASVQPPVVADPPISDAQEGVQVAAGAVQTAGLGLSKADLPPATLPPSAQLTYQVKGFSKGFNYVASGRLDWSHDGTTYQASMSVKALFLGSRGQTSVGRVSATGLAPVRFTDRSRSERAAHFERSTGKIRYSNNAPDAVLLPGAQDRLSVNFQLSALLNARPDAYAEGQTLHLPVSSHDVAELWLFQVGPMGTERLPAGDIVARQLTRSPRKEFDRKVELWLAPSVAHLPVRMRITERSGDFVDMQLEELPQLLSALEKPLPP
jgi:hypothetical protein